MEVDRIATAHIGARARNQLPVSVDDCIVDGDRLVGSSELIEAGVFDVDIAIVHEHHVAAAIDGGRLGLDDDVTGEVGDVDCESNTGRG